MLTPDDNSAAPRHGLIERAGVADALVLSPANEEAWIEVIRKMDQVYADLVLSQVELEQKNAELEQANQFIASILTAMTDLLVVCDRSGRIERVNPAMERLCGRNAEALAGAPLDTLLAPGSPPLFDGLRRRIHDDSGLTDLEVSMVDHAGRAVLLSLSCSPRSDQLGRLAGIVLIGRPVGELRRAYTELAAAHQKLRQTQQHLVFSEKMAALGRLVAGVAHELNNPISFVFGNMHALKRYGARLTEYLKAIDRGDSPEAIRDLRQRLKIDRILSDISPLVDGTLEGAERVSEIVQDLRRFSSSQAEPLEEFNLCRVIRTAVRWVEQAARVKPEIELELPPTLDVTSRRRPVHQILVNLVQNAADVMADQSSPRLRISAEIIGDRAWVRVRDFGPGISPSAMLRLFEPFFTTKPVGEGTGLGLYVSYGLAEELGGQLSATNHAGGGAEFTLCLPVKGEPNAAEGA